MYLNQKASWLTVRSKNAYGDFIYSDDAETIDVRRQDHIEEVRAPNGTIYHTRYIYYTRADVKVDDKLDGNLVVNSYDMRNLAGKCVMRRLKTI